MEKCTCFKCGKEMDNCDEDGNQPMGGTEFFTRGHYGSAVSDFMDGTGLAINVCDPCLVEGRTRQVVLVIEPPEPQPRPRDTYRVWR